jgi:hypothetical protein
MLPSAYAAAIALIREDIQAEVDSGFARLRRTPNTTTIKWLDYYAGLDPASRAAMHDAAAENAAAWFFLPSAVQDHLAARRAEAARPNGWMAASTSPRFTLGYRYRGLRDLKMILSDPECRLMDAQTRARLHPPPRDDPPPELMRNPDVTQAISAKAPQMRKLTASAMTTRFGAQKDKKPGGASVFTFTQGDLPVSVELDFAARPYSLRYGISAGDKKGPSRLRGFFYEILFGGGGGWDYVTEENAEASVALLCDYVAATVALFARVQAVARATAE